jgi:hypothetical protein
MGQTEMPTGVWICSECAHERGLTPKLADLISGIDHNWHNPVSIWEACPPKLMLEIVQTMTPYIEGEADGHNIDDPENRERWMNIKIAQRVVGVMNHIWYGPESLLR